MPRNSNKENGEAKRTTGNRKDSRSLKVLIAKTRQQGLFVNSTIKTQYQSQNNIGAVIQTLKKKRTKSGAVVCGDEGVVSGPGTIQF